MGTNYYAVKKKPRIVKIYDEIHLGKSSVGWKFVFQEQEQYHNFEEFKDFILNNDEWIIKNEYGEEISNSIEECLTKISNMNGIEISAEYRKDIENKLKESEEKLQKFKDTNKFINEITQNKKVATDEIAKIEKILSQEKRIKEEYEKRNSTAPPG